MTEHTIGNDELRISIESGPGYQPTPRLAAAIEELAAALEEADQGGDDDVAGFAFEAVALKPAFTLNYLSPTRVSYTENDSKGKKKGNVEYSWKIEQGGY